MANTDPTPEAGTSRRHRRRAREARRSRIRTTASVVSATAVTAAVLWGVGIFDSGGASGHSAAAARDPATTVEHPTTTVDTRPKCRSPLTADAPLKLWIGGDSLAGSLGPSLGNMTAATGVVAPVYDSRVSSGLSNPRFFDWPKHATQEMARLQPEVVAFIIGTNDYVVPGSVPTSAPSTSTTAAPLFTTTTTTTAPAGGSQPAWRTAYAAEVEQMLQILIGPGPVGRTVYWIGAPILKDPRMDAGASQVSQVAREVIARHPEVTYVDAHALFADANGKYTPTVTGIDGKKVVIRAGDGVHLTPEGGDKLAGAVMDLLDARCHVRAQAVPGVTQPVIQTKGSTAIPGTGRTPSSGSRTGTGSGGTTATTAAAPPSTGSPATTAPPATSPPTTQSTTPATTGSPPTT